MVQKLQANEPQMLKDVEDFLDLPLLELLDVSISMVNNSKPLVTTAAARARGKRRSSMSRITRDKYKFLSPVMDQPTSSSTFLLSSSRNGSQLVRKLLMKLSIERAEEEKMDIN